MKKILLITAAIAYLRLWLGDTYETAELRARTADCELRYLKKQINPTSSSTSSTMPE